MPRPSRRTRRRGRRGPEGRSGERATTAWLRCGADWGGATERRRGPDAVVAANASHGVPRGATGTPWPRREGARRARPPRGPSRTRSGSRRIAARRRRQ